MPQIPLFNQSQRLEPGSPAQAVSPEGSAGNLMGNMSEAFGNALFNLGNVLDNQAKVNKDAENKRAASILVNDIKQQQTIIQATMKGEGINLKDDPNGAQAGLRFKQASEEYTAKVLEKAAPNDIVKQMVLAGIGDDTAKGMSQVIVNEFSKRQDNLKLMRQEDLNGKAKLSRNSYPVAQIAMAEWEVSVMDDPTVPAAEKNKVIVDGKKAIATEAIRGILDKASMEIGSGSARERGLTFDAAMKKLNDDMPLIFTAEEKEKLSNEITAARNSFFSQTTQLYTAEEKLDAKIKADQQDRAELSYTENLIAAGSDQFKINAIMQQISKDPKLSAQSKSAFFSGSQKFAEFSNDKFEDKFNQKLYLGKYNTRSLLNDLNSAYARGELTLDRKAQLQKKVQEVADESQKNPGLTDLKRAAENEIRAAFGGNIFDTDQKLYKGENSREAAEAISHFSKQMSVLYSSKNVNAASIEQAKNNTLTDFGKPVIKRANGTGNLVTNTSAEKTREAMVALAIDTKKNGATWDAATKKKKLEQAANLQNNLRALEFQEKFKINIKGGGSTPANKPAGD